MLITPKCSELVVRLVLWWQLSSAVEEKILYRWSLKKVDFVVGGSMLNIFHIQMDRIVVTFVY